jgi:hypothetical protein
MTKARYAIVGTGSRATMYLDASPYSDAGSGVSAGTLRRRHAYAAETPFY